MALLDNVRDFCGLSSDFNNALVNIIDSCKADLKRVGVVNIKDADPLISTACELYAGYKRDINGKGQIYRADYEIFRNGLAQNEDYITEVPDV